MRVFALLLLMPVSLAAADGFKHEAAINKYVQDYLDAQVCQAVSVGVVQGDQIWTAHFGTMSADDQSKPTDRTLYEIGSISKVFTGVLLADAVESGAVKLNQPIGTLMKRLAKENKDVGESITLQHLSTHSSGLPRMPSNFAPAAPNNPFADYSRDQLDAFMCSVKPDSKPGEKWAYSNLAVGLLGELLADKAGVAYDQLLRQTITGPLKMKDSAVVLSDKQLSRIAPPHDEAFSPASVWDFKSLSGAGGIRSTAPDMLRFAGAVLNPPKTQLGKALELSWQQHAAPINGSFAMGLGWNIARDGKTRFHGGQTGGYHATLFVSREINTAVVVLSNVATPEIDVMAESIIQLCYGMPLKPREFGDPKVDQETMKRLVGRYQIVPQFVLDVKQIKNRLMVQATNQPSIRVYPESATRWKYRVVKAEITFELPEEGPATALTLHQNGRDMRGARIEKKDPAE